MTRRENAEETAPEEVKRGSKSETIKAKKGQRKGRQGRTTRRELKPEWIQRDRKQWRQKKRRKYKKEKKKT